MLGEIDTLESVARMQIELWRHMTPAEKLELVSGTTRACLDLCRAGIRLRHPGASESEVDLRFALITLGQELTLKAWPEAASLVRSTP